MKKINNVDRYMDRLLNESLASTKKLNESEVSTLLKKFKVDISNKFKKLKSVGMEGSEVWDALDTLNSTINLYI